MDEYEEYTQEEIASEYAKCFPVEEYPYPDEAVCEYQTAFLSPAYFSVSRNT